MRSYEVLESTSELLIRVYGHNLEHVFVHALAAMFDCMEPVMAPDGRAISVDIALTALDQEQLLVDFLSEALVFADTKNAAFTKVRFHELSERSLIATLEGTAVVKFGMDIKAVTHHRVDITASDDHLATDLLFDI